MRVLGVMEHRAYPKPSLDVVDDPHQPFSTESQTVAHGARQLDCYSQHSPRPRLGERSFAVLVLGIQLGGLFIVLNRQVFLSAAGRFRPVMHKCGKSVTLTRNTSMARPQLASLE